MTWRDFDCKEWPQRFTNGYARFHIGSKSVRANREVWKRERGPIPRGMCVLHHCDNPACIEVEHLWLGTVADNNRDRAEKRRSTRADGERNNNAKLTDQQREWMRGQRFEGVKQKDLAAFYGVSRPNIVYVCRGVQTMEHRGGRQA